MRAHLLLLASILPFAACGGGPPAPDWNLILISLDTCRADRLSHYGAERPNSPQLDRLAAEAAVFDDCHCTSTVTAPSHRSLFTSHYVERHGVRVNGRPAHSPYTLAGLLQERGYRTAAFVGGGPLLAKYGLDQGFEHYEATSGLLNVQAGTLAKAVERGLDWLEIARDRPFFLFLHGYDPHCPYLPPETTRHRYGGWYRGAFDPKGRCGRDGFEPLYQSGQFGPDEERYLRDLYDEEILAADAAAGRLLDALRAQGLLDRSLVVFLSDHGESLGERRYVGHARLWEEQLRVPLLLRFPGGRYAGRYPDPVQLVDVLPTILSALGVPAPEGMQGVDLLPRLRGAADALPERLRISQVGAQTAVAAGARWKIVFRTDRAGAIHGAVYDLENDPEELHDLYDTVEGRAAYERLYARFQDWQREQSAGDAGLRARAIEAAVTAEDRAALAELGYAGAEDGGPEDAGD